MITDLFLKVLAKEGVAPIVSWANGDAHVAATWNSYINVTPDRRLLIPAAGMRTTESNVDVNNRIKMVFGSKEIKGMHGMGAGFALEGTARFLDEGPEFATMKEKFPFLNRVLEVTVTKLTQTL